MHTNDLAEESVSAGALLRFLVEAGADECIGEAALDRTELPSSRKQAPAAQPAAQPGPQSGAAAAKPAASPRAPEYAPGLTPAAASAAPPVRQPISPAMLSAQAAETAATRAAQACGDLAQLKAAVSAFEGCALKATATNTVFARGNPAAPLLLIGEAPGRDEDAQGLPFVGQSGQLLDRMLAAIGRSEDNTYISNVIFWRPPGNRDPSPEEIIACKPFVERLIAIVRPKLICFVGRHSAGTLLGTSQGITKLRGRWHVYAKDGLEIPAMPMLHPAYLLRQPGMKREAWRDMLSVAAKLRELGV